MLKYENGDLTVDKKEKDSSLRIMTYNVHGFKNRDNIVTYDSIINNIKYINPDILVLQEVFVFRVEETSSKRKKKRPSFPMISTLVLLLYIEAANIRCLYW